MRILFSFLLFTFHFASTAQIPSYVPTNGLVGWWPFNGNANDESGNGHHGTTFNLSYGLDRNNAENSCLTLNQIGSGAEFLSGKSYWQNDYAISFWFNPTINSNNQRILGYRPSCSGDGEYWFEFEVANNSQQLYHGYSGSGWTYGNIIPNTWNNAIFIKQGIVGSLYVNGILLNQHLNLLLLTQDAILALSSRNFCILNYGQNDLRYIGSFDDLAVWNRALTQEEITQLYTGSFTPSIPEDTTSNVGIGTATPKRKLHVNDVMRLEPRNSAPSNPGEGDIYYDAILKKIRYYNGTGWISL